MFLSRSQQHPICFDLKIFKLLDKLVTFALMLPWVSELVTIVDWNRSGQEVAVGVPKTPFLLVASACLSTFLMLRINAVAESVSAMVMSLFVAVGMIGFPGAKFELAVDCSVAHSHDVTLGVG